MDSTGNTDAEGAGAAASHVVEPAISRCLSFDQLPVSERWLFVWGVCWRGVLAVVCSGVLGAFFGALLALLGQIVAISLGLDSLRDASLARVMGGVGGALAGGVMLWQYVRWLFRVDWRGYSLVLVKHAPEAPAFE